MAWKKWMGNPCESVKHTKIVFSDEDHPECKSKFTLFNERGREIRKCKIDGNGGIFNDVAFKKCDWLAIDVTTKNEIYIELKSGYGVEQGVEQILITVQKVREKRELNVMLSENRNAVKLGYVIHSSTKNPAFEPKTQNLLKGVKQSHNLIIQFRKTPHEEKISDLIEKIENPTKNKNS